MHRTCWWMAKGLIRSLLPRSVCLPLLCLSVEAGSGTNHQVIEAISWIAIWGCICIRVGLMSCLSNSAKTVIKGVLGNKLSLKCLFKLNCYFSPLLIGHKFNTFSFFFKPNFEYLSAPFLSPAIINLKRNSKDKTIHQINRFDDSYMTNRH